MPLLARWYIKTALLYLVGALLMGVVIAAAPAAGMRIVPVVLWTTYLHLFVVGWLTQLIIGVAVWLFPRHSKERPFGAIRLAGVVYALLNLGLLARAVAEPGLLLTGAGIWHHVLLVSAALQWVAGLLFVVYIWSRVRTK